MIQGRCNLGKLPAIAKTSNYGFSVSGKYVAGTFNIKK